MFANKSSSGLSRSQVQQGSISGKLSNLFPPLIQPKLKIGAPNDKYEQEADRVADQVMRMPEMGSVQTRNSPPQIQRLCPESDAALQRQPEEEEEEEELLQTKAAAGQIPSMSNNTATAIQSLKGGGQPLSTVERHFFEPRFNKNFSQVRIHTDNRAQHAAQLVKARAFTLGKDIVFNQAQFNPGSSDGRRLLAHELTHVVQQGAGKKPVSNSLVQQQAIPSKIQRTPIPDSAVLADFVSWTQRAIDNMQAGHRERLGQETSVILQGLRTHITLKDASGNIVTDGGVFSLGASSVFSNLPNTVNFKLIVDDATNPRLGATFTPPPTRRGDLLITIFANKFRGDDHTNIDDALYHEAVHALFYMQRTFSSLRLRQEAQNVLDVSAHNRFFDNVRRHIQRILPGDPRVGRLSRSLTEEILVMVESKAYGASTSGVSGVTMDLSEFTSTMTNYIFEGGHLLTQSDRRTIPSSLLSPLLRVLHDYYRYLYRLRLMQMRMPLEGMTFSERRRPEVEIGPRMQHRSFIPELIRSVDDGPF